MNNTLLQVKIKLRLNKLASGDYDNIEAWQIIEAFNKVQLQWVRQQLAGSNVSRTGDEGSKQRIDDLQLLLTTIDLKGSNQRTFFLSVPIPGNYLSFKRVQVQATHPDCEGSRPLRVDLAEEGNADHYLRDPLIQPSWEWAETFCTLAGNQFRIYTNGAFSVLTAALQYYRLPRDIRIAGVVDPASGIISVADSTCEFKADVAELLVDLTAAQLAGDIENYQQVLRNQQAAQSVP